MIALSKETIDAMSGVNVLRESLIELARIVLLSIIPILVSSIDVKTGSFNINWSVVGAVAVVAVLRWLDKLLHLYGKQTGNTTMISGLTRF